MISAKVIADSKNEFGNRITTMVVTFPRIILAEFNTHRMFSRNSASSRAIPYEKMLKSVQENPFVPIAWQKDHKGMQGTEYFPAEGFTAEQGIGAPYLKQQWLNARDQAIMYSEVFSKDDVTKQLCNRLLEPFMWHTVIVTATEWENFFHLRCPQYTYRNLPMPDGFEKTFRSWKDYTTHMATEAPLVITPEYLIPSNEFKLSKNKGAAEIHAMALAEAMWDAYNESIPQELKAGEWHIPFGGNLDSKAIRDFLNPSYKPEDFHQEAERINKELSLLMIKIATARCARISYTVVGEEGKPDNYENDVKLHDRLLASGHMSPFEHCAMAMGNMQAGLIRGEEQGHASWSGNFKGFIQYRKTIPGENVTK